MGRRKTDSVMGVHAPAARLTVAGSAIVSGIIALMGGSLIALVQLVFG